MSNDKRKNPAVAAADEVIAYFAREFGPVEQRSFIEIVPSGHPVAVHVILPGEGRDCLTLFTTGLSTQLMAVPEGAEDYAVAELFMQLPADWPVQEMNDPNWGWPVIWLRKMAQYPHDNGTWLGGPLTIVANEEPPEPLAPNTPMSCLLLLAETNFVRSDGRPVVLYRMSPLHADERELELREGSPALMQAMDRADVPMVVDVDRASVVGR